MKSLIAPLAALGLLAAAIGTARAAPPDYCALYAREYANQFAAAAGRAPGSEQRIQDEAYYRCLNLDEEPEMPSTSAYYGTSVDSTAEGGQGGPLEPAPDTAAPAEPTGEAAAAPADTPAPAAPAKPAKKTAEVTSVKRGYTSGAEPGTPEWRAWCRKNFPNSFNEKDGTIKPYGAKERQLCK